MSRAETVPSPAGTQPRGRWRWSPGFFRSEFTIVMRRRRTLALLAVLAGVPVLIGIAVKLQTGDGGSAGGGGEGGGGPAFIAQITNNGLFLVFTGLAATLPFFLPMAVGVIAGDSVAGRRTPAPCATFWSPPSDAPGCCWSSTPPSWRSASSAP